MNRLHSWKICAGMATALLLFTACSQDELTEQGTPLPVGQYPLELTADGVAVATSAQPATRGTFFEGDWNGVTGVRVRVNDKEEKEYSVTPSEDKKTARLAPAKPLGLDDNLFWWNSTTDEKTVTAWAPSEYVLDKTIEFPTVWKREDFAKYDIIGVRQTIDFENRNAPLEFQHMMTKFVINLRKTPYLENAENVNVQLTGALWKYGTMYIHSYFGFFKIRGEYSGNDVYITPYPLPEEEYEEVDFGDGLPEKPFASYMALVPPTQGIVSPLLTVEVDGTKYQLLQSSFTDEQIVYYNAGQVYTFNVTVKENGLDVTVGESIGWDTGNTGSGEVELP
ncbi:fimbrillin family protein [Bacteroides fragilis]